MPFLLPALGAIFSLGGLLGSTGAIATALAGTVGTGIAGAIGGALMGATIGAAIGGLGALVMGGDIGKGMLFGAIGGAVTGGITGFMDAGAFASMGANEGVSNAISSSGFTDSAMMSGKTITSSGIVKDTLSAGATEAMKKGASGSLMSTIGKEGMGAAIEGGIGLIGQTMQGMGAEEKWKAEMQAQQEEAEKQRQFEMKALKMKLAASAGGGGGGSAPDRDWAAELAEQRRQFDVEMNQRRTEFAQSMGIRKEELYAPMEYEKEKVARAGSTLANVKTSRGQYKNAATIKSQLQGANAFPEPVQVPAEQPVPQEVQQ